MPLLQIENLTHFFGGLEAVSNFEAQIEKGEIDELRAQLTAAEDRLASLQRGLAGTQVPFDLFAEAFDIAEESRLRILSVEREEVGTQDTGDGSLTATRFSFQAEGRFPAFLEFVENLEATAPKSVSLDGMLVTHEERSCLFEVIVLSGLEVESADVSRGQSDDA